MVFGTLVLYGTLVLFGTFPFVIPPWSLLTELETATEIKFEDGGGDTGDSGDSGDSGEDEDEWYSKGDDGRDDIDTNNKFVL